MRTRILIVISFILALYGGYYFYMLRGKQKAAVYRATLEKTIQNFQTAPTSIDSPQQIHTTSQDYNNLHIDACPDDQNGPKSFKTFMNVNIANVMAFDVWTNPNKALLERVLYLDHPAEKIITLLQQGCDHSGWEYSVTTTETFPNQDTVAMINQALSLLSKGQEINLINTTLFGLGNDALDLAKDRFAENKMVPRIVSQGDQTETKEMPICDNSQYGRIFCSSYEDPNNYELTIDMTANQTRVSLKYWYVF